MNKEKFFKIRIYFTLIVGFSIWTLLLWYHFNGGVPKHHFLADEEFPAISNWWGALLLPLLTWFLLSRVDKRKFRSNDDSLKAPQSFKSELYGFAWALMFGITLSAFFTSGNTEVPGYMVMGIFLVAFFYPIYRSQYLLGFVIGMTFTFGAVLPTLVGTILCLFGLVIYKFLRVGLFFLWSKSKMPIAVF